jgi:hypothetical protein
MREIKFRGQRINTKEWVYGYYVKGSSERHFICTPYHADIEVNAESVGQFTGLPANGYEDDNTEIYEGDIVEFINGKRVSVEWNDDTCQFQFSDGQPINNDDTYGIHKAVIGNIYQHPELLTT